MSSRKPHSTRSRLGNKGRSFSSQTKTSLVPMPRKASKKAIKATSPHPSPKRSNSGYDRDMNDKASNRPSSHAHDSLPSPQEKFDSAKKQLIDIFERSRN